MEVMAMENNHLKERIRKSVKEKIAVSNIREEFGMKSKKSRWREGVNNFRLSTCQLNTSTS